jgi:3',5'-cyclic AMP phosphodiesterase CpdA
VFRILHISDLHIVAPSVAEHRPTVLQSLVKYIGKSKFDTEVNAKAWDRSKLKSLVNVARSLQPDLIVVTGDLTNYGDDVSFQLAFEIIDEIKREANAKHVLCVPGNHDTLVERAVILEKTSKTRRMLAVVATAISEVDAIRAAAERSLQTELTREHFPSLHLTDAAPPPKLTLPFLENYLKRLPKDMAVPDAGVPIEIKLESGTALFFLINTNSVHALMANEGEAGSNVYAAIEAYRSKNADKFDTSLKFALLHHHPISAPQKPVNAGIRAYDWMRDGPLLLEYLQRSGFRFILHGHEHVPFDCTVRYASDSEWLHIIAAGSALQGGDRASFNAIELRSAYVAYRTRWNWTPTGFATAGLPLSLQLRPVTPLRLFSHGENDPMLDIANTDDTSLYNLSRTDFDFGNNYSSLRAVIEITGDNIYRATYTYTGKVITQEGGLGPIVTITGNPAMDTDLMKLGGIDNQTKLALEPLRLSDNAYQKVVRFQYITPRAVQSDFDVSISFEWQSNPQEAHCWDAFNLASYRGPLMLFAYDLTVPSKPSQFQVICLGAHNYAPPMKQDGPEELADGRWHWKFTIDNPEPVMTTINFHLPDCRHQRR